MSDIIYIDSSDENPEPPVQDGMDSEARRRAKRNIEFFHALSVARSRRAERAERARSGGYERPAEHPGASRPAPRAGPRNIPGYQDARREAEYLPRYEDNIQVMMRVKMMTVMDVFTSVPIRQTAAHAHEYSRDAPPWPPEAEAARHFSREEWSRAPADMLSEFAREVERLNARVDAMEDRENRARREFLSAEQGFEDSSSCNYHNAAAPTVQRAPPAAYARAPPHAHSHAPPVALARALPAAHVRALPAAHVRALPAAHDRALPAAHVRALPAAHARAPSAAHARAPTAAHVRALPAAHARAPPTMWTGVPPALGFNDTRRYDT